MYLKYPQLVTEILEEGYDRIIVPIAVEDTQIQMERLKLVDEEDNDLLNEDGSQMYASINVLHQIKGKQFYGVPIIDERFISVRWSFDEDDKEKPDFKQFLIDMTLVDMRTKGQKIEDIDFTNLNGNEFLLCSKRESKKVPRPTVGEL